MTESTAAEVVLFLLCGMVWVGPLAVSLRRGTAVLAHPTGYFPAFLYFTVFVAMAEHWFGWSGRSMYPGIRLETQYYEYLPWFYVEPLVILLLVGVAYHCEVRKGAGTVLPTPADRIHLESGLPAVRTAEPGLRSSEWVSPSSALRHLSSSGRGAVSSGPSGSCIRLVSSRFF